jgi:hypothetical protein
LEASPAPIKKSKHVDETRNQCRVVVEPVRYISHPTIPPEITPARVAKGIDDGG